MSEQDKKDVVEAAAEKTQDAVKRVNPKGISSLARETGTGFIALSAAIYTATIAFNKFRDVYEGRGKATS
jgi:hypothetical protein